MSNLHGAFVPRLSNQASIELLQLREIIQQLSLVPGNDSRKSLFDCGPGKLDSSAIYRLLKSRQQPSDPSADFVWKNAAPPRVQFFMWLASKLRIQCRVNLFKKKITDSQVCEACGHPAETTDHVLLHCPFARSFWTEIGLQIYDDFSIKSMHSMPKIQALPATQYNTLFALRCWQLWKRRNALIFRNESQSGDASLLS